MAHSQTPEPEPGTEPPRSAQDVDRRNSLILGAMCLLIALVVWVSNRRATDIWGIMFWLAPLLIGVFNIGRGLIGVVRGLKLAPAEVSFAPQAACPGESFVFRYSQRFKERMEVDFARVTFYMREAATFQQGKSSSTVENKVVVSKSESPGRVY